MKTITKMFLAIFAAGILVGCGNNGSTQTLCLEQIKQKGMLVVGVFSDKPPFGFVNEKGENDGFDVYIARELANCLCRFTLH